MGAISKNIESVQALGSDGQRIRTDLINDSPSFIHHIDFGEGGWSADFLEILVNDEWYLAENPDVALGGLDPRQHFETWGYLEGRSPNPLFDPIWYFETYPDVASSGMSAIAHYMRFGAAEGRSPSALFDVDWYRAHYPDLADAGVPLLEHFLRHGRDEGRIPTAYFDAEWYLTQNPDVAAHGVDPLHHFATWGYQENRSPNPLFDPAWYIETYPDVASSGMIPIAHYLQHGVAEGRMPSALFDADWYWARYPDRHNNGLSALQNYILFGRRGQQIPTPYFDPDWYKRANPDTVAASISPYDHFVKYGRFEERSPHPLFDAAWYRDANPDVALSGLSTWDHFLSIGLAEGRNPGPLFDADWYRYTYPDAAASCLRAFDHFVQFGLREGHDPGPLFDSAWYQQRYGEKIDPSQSPLEHFLGLGLYEDLDPNPVFDSRWYRQHHRDLSIIGVSSFSHYLNAGMRERRQPHPLFLPDWYSRQLTQKERAEKPAYLHFMRAGMSAGRAPSPLVDIDWYLQQNPDVAESGMSPNRHLFQYGFREGRTIHPLVDETWYRKSRPEIDWRKWASGFEHFVTEGLYEGCDPHPLFDAKWYVAANDVITDGLPPFIHYLIFGDEQNNSTCPLFYPKIFLDSSPKDGAGAFDSALAKYVKSGQVFSGNPCPLFDDRWYIEKNGTEFSKDVPALLHYIDHPNYGPHPLFDPPFVLEVLGKDVNHREGETWRYLDDAKWIALTSITREQLPQAKLLAQSLKALHPEAGFCVFLCDAIGGVDRSGAVYFDALISLDELLGEDWESFAFEYEASELCEAIKPYAFQNLLAGGAKQLVYIAADTLLFQRMDRLLGALDRSAIVVTPQRLMGDERPEVNMTDPLDAIQDGILEGGLIALRKDDQADRFLDWWAANCRSSVAMNDGGASVVGNRILDLAVSHHPSVTWYRDPAYNVAAGNYRQRGLTGDLFTGFQVGGAALVSFRANDEFGQPDNATAPRNSATAALSLIHEWRRARLAVLTAVETAPANWALGSFSTGDKITRKHRRIYKHSSLKTRFPHPFGKESDRFSFRNFLAERGDLARIGAVGPSGSVGATPLARYLTFVRDNPLLPTSKYFDPAYYLAANPDVVAARSEPAAHFMRYGLKEGRKPHPDVDLDIYRTQVGLDTNEDALRSLMEDGRRPEARLGKCFDPISDRFCLDEFINGSRGRPTILLISHRGGGTQRHVEDLVRYFSDRVNFFLLVPHSRNVVQLSREYRDQRALYFDLVSQKDVLAEIVKMLGVKRVHVHQAKEMERFLGDLLATLQLPYDLTLHDLGLLSPSPFFQHDRKLSIKAQIEANFSVDLARIALGVDTAKAWRAALLSILTGAARVIVPSKFVRTTFRSFYPELPYVLAPHLERPAIPAAINATSLSTKLTIGILGELYRHKGFSRFLSVAAKVRERDLPIRFVVIGPSQDDDLLRLMGIDVVGPYKDSELSSLITKHDVKAIWFTNEAAETYSYTLSAALTSGLPIIATDVGCFPERLKGFRQASIFPVTDRPEDWVEHLMDLLARIKAGEIETDVFNPEPSEFYRNQYFPPREKPTATEI